MLLDPKPALSRLVLREMVFYDSGAQAGRFQKNARAADRAYWQRRTTGDRTKRSVNKRNIEICRLDNFLHLSGRVAPLAIA